MREMDFVKRSIFNAKENHFNLLETLSKLRTKALRKKIWFTTLTAQERTLVGLVCKNVKIVKNSTLATVIARLIVKLLPAVRNAFWSRVEKVGRPIAEAYAKGALAMGWKGAESWPNDPNIVRWLGLVASLNSGGVGRW